MRKTPESVLTARVSTLVSVSTAVTETPGIAAPVESVMMPFSSLRSPWANRLPAKASTVKMLRIEMPLSQMTLR